MSENESAVNRSERGGDHSLAQMFSAEAVDQVSYDTQEASFTGIDRLYLIVLIILSLFVSVLCGSSSGTLHLLCLVVVDKDEVNDEPLTNVTVRGYHDASPAIYTSLGGILH